MEESKVEGDKQNKVAQVDKDNILEVLKPEQGGDYHVQEAIVDVQACHDHDKVVRVRQSVLRRLDDLVDDSLYGHKVQTAD